MLSPVRPPLNNPSATRPGQLTLANVINDANDSSGLLHLPGATYIGPAVTNSCTNPEFETDTSGWGTYNGGAGTVTIARITSNFFRGVACGHFVTDGASNNQAALAPMTGVGTYVQNDTVAIQTEVYSPAGGEVVVIQCNEYDAAGNYLASHIGSTFTLVAGWQKLTFITTLTQATCSRIIPTVGTRNTGAGQAVALDIDCFMWEKSAVVNPYTATSRSAGRVQMPWDAGLCSLEQGWVAIRSRRGFASASGPSTPVVMAWENGAFDNRFTLYRSDSTHWKFDTTRNGTNTLLQQSGTSSFSVGDFDMLLVAWNPAAIGLSVSGGSLATAARGGTPGGAAPQTTIDFGSRSGSTLHMCSDAAWAVVGNGRPTDADSAGIQAAFATAKPTIRALDQVARGAHAMAVWDGRTDTFQRRIGA